VTQAIVAALNEVGRGDLPLVVGGTIRPFDVDGLQAAGVRAIFRGGESFANVVETVRDLATEARGRRATTP
jgi:methylmalonyl-CoA mutase cobalamin-binding domain/chain